MIRSMIRVAGAALLFWAVAAQANLGVSEASAPAQAAKTPAVTIPQGTPLRVRTVDPIDVDSSQAGMKFRGTLDDPIMINGNVIVPRGADVTLQAAKVQQSGKMKGSDLIQLKVNSIVVKGKSYPVVTSFQEVKGGSEGKSTAKKGLGGAGLGAIIGGIAGGGTGAAIGAAAGGATGLIVSASGQQHLKVPSETRMEFRLESAVKVNP
jgi:outer membrane lipoprotein SlyB